MAEEKRKKVLELPIKVIFNETGISFFLKGNKKLTKFKTVDDVDQYGIYFDTFAPASVQKMLLVNYVAFLEIGRPEYTTKRQDVIDLSKLITYGTLYRSFDEVIFGKLLDSQVVQAWNLAHTDSPIERTSSVAETQLTASLEANRATVVALKQEIMANIVKAVQVNDTLLPEEKNLQIFLADKFLTTLRPFVWSLFVKFRENKDFSLLLAEVESILKDFMLKSKISEFLSMMTVELAILGENANVQSFAKARYKGTLDPVEINQDTEMRKMIVEEMRLRNQNVFLSWRVGGESSKTQGGRERLQIKIYSKDSATLESKRPVGKPGEEVKPPEITKRSLMDFYKDVSTNTAGNNAELGLYYLTYLTEECGKVGVQFEGGITELRDSSLNVITLNLLF